MLPWPETPIRKAGLIAGTQSFLGQPAPHRQHEGDAGGDGNIGPMRIFDGRHNTIGKHHPSGVNPSRALWTRISVPVNIGF